MPSPILIYSTGRFKHMRRKNTLPDVVCSKQYPVQAYRRNTTSKKSTKGAWGYVPKRGKKVIFRVSIVYAPHARPPIDTRARDMARLSKYSVALPYDTKRHTTDWVFEGKGKPSHKDQLSAATIKAHGKPKKYTKRAGRGVAVTYEEFEKYMATATTERKKSRKKRQQAREAKTIETAEKKADAAVVDAKTALKLDTKVADSPKATPAQKKKAKERVKQDKKEVKKSEVLQAQVEDIAAKAKRSESKKKAKKSSKKKTTKKKSSVRSVMK